MTRTEEKLYVHSVFQAIDQAYQMKNQKPVANYEERLRASFNKLLVPDWYNHQYTTGHGLRKTKSQGHVPRVKRVNGDTNNNHNNNNNNNHQHHDETPDISVTSSLYSPHLSNGSHRASLRHRSPSRSWSERPPVRRDSTTSSYDTNTSIINGRRSVLSNGGSSYAPGTQRVAQSSTWYKPRPFTIQLAKPSIEPPKPFPRYSKMEQERLESTDDIAPGSSKSIDRSVRCPIKPRVMAEAEEPKINTSFEADKTLVQEPSTIEHNNDSLLSSDIPRADSIRSISSDAESYRSALLPSTEKNLLATDSSSYASVNERCLSPSTSSYHTAIAGDTTSSSSSIAGYETPTPQFDDDDDDHATLSSHSSLSDLSHAETLEPNADDLDPAPAMSVTLVEESSTIDITTTDPEPTTIHVDTNPSTTNVSNPIDQQHWYDGSLETCIHKTNGSNQSEQSEIREISNDEDLREIDLNAVGDEFFLFSPPQNNDEESSTSITDSKSDQTSDSFPSPTQTSKRVFSMQNPMNNLYDPFHYSSSSDPFGFESNQSSSLMITNLDDMFMNDEDDQELLNATDQYFSRTYRRPIQEDILYEVEHENSYSDHSQNTSSIVPIDEQVLIKVDGHTDFLMSADESLTTNVPVTSDQETSLPSDQQPSSSVNNEATTLPIYMLPPLYTTSGFKNTGSSMVSNSPTTLHIETGDEHLQKWDALISQLTSPSLYTSKIRHRHYSVGSYYDHKSGNVPLHSNHTLYLLGSAPVSPLSRTSTTSNDSHYHNSPISLTPLRRINPFIDANYDQHHSFIRRNEATRMTTRTFISPPLNIKPIATSLPFPLPPSFTETSASLNTNLNSAPSPSSMRTSSVPFQPYEIPATTSLSSSPPPPPPPPRTVPPPSQSIIDSPRKSPEKIVTRPQTSRGPRHNPPVPPRTITTERDSSQHVYQEIDRKSIQKRRANPPNPDIQFIRAAIERVFDFRVGSTSDTTSDASTYYEEVSDNEGNSSVSSSTLLKKTNQYPAVEAIERFYKDKRIPVEPVTNLDDFPSSKSSNVNQNHSRSPPIVTIRMKDRTKSSDIERASSEEVDDTLNDIDDVDEHDDQKGRCRMSNGSKSKRTSQETQTIDQSRMMMINQHQRRSHSPSPPVRTMVPPIDIVTEMIVEQENVPDTAVESEDMIIFYDDIEIVENSSSSSYSSDSGSESDSNSAANHYSKPNPAAPPIPARTLKPVSSINQQTNTNRTNNTKKIYELDPPTMIRKRFDVNSVNDILNRTDQNIASSTSHRHPSARHFVGKLNNEDAALPPTKPITNGNHQRVPTKSFCSIVPPRSSSTLPHGEIHRSVLADTNALVKQIQNSLSRNSLHDRQINSTLSTSSKDLRAFVSSTYSPSHENILDDREVHHRRIPPTVQDDQPFKRQARLSKSFHNVSEYNGNDSQTNHQPVPLLNKGPPSKSVENDLDQVHPRNNRPIPITFKLTSAVVGTSFSTLLSADDNHRLLSTKWYTGHVSENSEISYEKTNLQPNDLLHGYISTHGNQEIQRLFARLQQSNDTSVHTALEDIRARVAEFDKFKKLEDLQVFMGYLERRLRGIHSNKSNPTSTSIKTRITNGSSSDSPSADTLSLKSRSSLNGIKETNPSRQIGRQQQLRGTQQTNGHHPIPPRRSSQSSSNQENPILIEETSTNGFGLPKKKNISLSQERPPPIVSTQMTTNTKAVHKAGRDIGKRLFESGTYKDPRLIYDGPKQVEKGEEPLETSV